MDNRHQRVSGGEMMSAAYDMSYEFVVRSIERCQLQKDALNDLWSKSIKLGDERAHLAFAYFRRMGICVKSVKITDMRFYPARNPIKGGLVLSLVRDKAGKPLTLYSTEINGNGNKVREKFLTDISTDELQMRISALQGTTLGIVSGIENALAVKNLCHDEIPVWAVRHDLKQVINFEPPMGIENIICFCSQFASKEEEHNIKIFKALMKDKGLKVSIVTPFLMSGKDGKRVTTWQDQIKVDPLGGYHIMNILTEFVSS